MNFLECGDCNACCSGNLAGVAHGIPFGNGTPCSFLCNSKCTIYDIRPAVCRGYQCAWSQGLFTPELKPNISNLLISVELDTTGMQYLKLIPLSNDVSQETIEYINNWVDNNNTYYVVTGVYNEVKSRFRPQAN